MRGADTNIKASAWKCITLLTTIWISLFTPLVTLAAEDASSMVEQLCTVVSFVSGSFGVIVFILALIGGAFGALSGRVEAKTVMILMVGATVVVFAPSLASWITGNEDPCAAYS
jgi:MFS family permease